MKYYALLVAGLLVFANVSVNGDTRCKLFDAEESIKKIDKVSIISLIASPDKYNGKKVKVVGCINVEFEGTALYLSCEDRKRRVTKNAIWLAVDHSLIGRCKHIDGQYVSIIGVYNSEGNGHMGEFSGSLVDITGIDY